MRYSTSTVVHGLAAAPRLRERLAGAQVLDLGLHQHGRAARRGRLRADLGRLPRVAVDLQDVARATARSRSPSSGPSPRRSGVHAARAAARRPAAATSRSRAPWPRAARRAGPARRCGPARARRCGRRAAPSTAGGRSAPSSRAGRAATSRIVRLTSCSVSESSDEVASSNTSRCGRRSSARAIDSRCFSPPETLTPPSPISVSRPLLGARQERLAGRALEHVQALRVARVGADEQQVLADRAREQLRVLGHEADPLAQPLEVDPVVGRRRRRGCARRRGRYSPTSSLTSVVLPGARGAHERDRLAAPQLEAHVLHRWRRRRLVGEATRPRSASRVSSPTSHRVRRAAARAARRAAPGSWRARPRSPGRR